MLGDGRVPAAGGGARCGRRRCATCCSTKRRTARRRPSRRRRVCIRTRGSAAPATRRCCSASPGRFRAAPGAARRFRRSANSTAARVQAGQWWRAWTALTLHLDGAAPGRESRRRHLVRLSRRAPDGQRHGLAADRHAAAALANLLEGLLGSARAQRRWRLHRRVQRARGNVGLLVARALGAAAALGAPLGAAGRRRDPARLDRIRRGGHDSWRTSQDLPRARCSAPRRRCRACSSCSRARAAVADAGRGARLARHRLGLRAAELSDVYGPVTL